MKGRFVQFRESENVNALILSQKNSFIVKAAPGYMKNAKVLLTL